MIKKNIHVPLYDFNIKYIEVESKNDVNEITRELKKLNVTNEHIQMVCDNVTNDRTDGGETFRNLNLKRFIVVIYRCSTNTKRRNVINHEKRHVEDRILEHLGINDIEASAYLAGFLSEYMY
jgi:hypothetical protein